MTQKWQSSLSIQILLLLKKKENKKILYPIVTQVSWFKFLTMCKSQYWLCHLLKLATCVRVARITKFLCLTSLSTLLPHPCSVWKASAVIQSLCPILQYDKSISMQHRFLINICQSLFGNLPTLMYSNHSLSFFI